jgi:hypothetical protein
MKIACALGEFACKIGGIAARTTADNNEDQCEQHGGDLDSEGRPSWPPCRTLRAGAPNGRPYKQKPGVVSHPGAIREFQFP